MFSFMKTSILKVTNVKLVLNYLSRFEIIRCATVVTIIIMIETMDKNCKEPSWQARGVTGSFSRRAFYLLQNRKQFTKDVYNFSSGPIKEVN